MKGMEGALAYYNELSQHLSAVGIATVYGLDDGEVRLRVPVGSRIFSSPQRPTQPPMQWVPGALPPVVKRPERQADNSPPTSAEVKETWINTSSPPTRLHGVMLN
jgi:hypothetical protein